MSLKAKSSVEKSTGNSGIEPLEAGTYPARVSAVVDLGTQNRPAWQGQEKKPAPMVWIQYSFLTEEYVDPEKGPTGEPRVLSESFPMFSRKAERSKASVRLTRIDPKGEIDDDFSQLLGLPVQVTVVRNKGKGKYEGRVFANVADVTAPMKGVVVEDFGEDVKPVLFDIDNWDQDVYEGLPQFVQDRIEARIDRKSPEPSPSQRSDSKEDWEV